MDESQQDKTGSKLIATEDKSQLPLFLPKEEKEAQKELDHLRKCPHKDRKKVTQSLLVVGISAALVGVIVLIIGRWFGFNWLWREISIPQVWQIISLVLIGIVLLILLIRVGYTAQWRGFKDKTAWDYIDLLIRIVGTFAVPLSIIGLIISVGQFNTQQQAAQSQALNQQRQETLQTYLADLMKLYSGMHLKSPDPKYANDAKNASVVARAKTLTALQGLDPERKSLLIQFLSEAQLITCDKGGRPIFSLDTADLKEVNLTRANLRGAHLEGAHLERADLTGADLTGADLSGANLFAAHLIEVQFPQANLRGADLRGAHLEGAHLERADLTGADLRGAILWEAPLAATLDKTTILKGARYNTKEVQTKDLPVPLPPTQWPPGFDFRAAGAIEENTV